MSILYICFSVAVSGKVYINKLVKLKDMYFEIVFFLPEVFFNLIIFLTISAILVNGTSSVAYTLHCSQNRGSQSDA